MFRKSMKQYVLGLLRVAPALVASANASPDQAFYKAADVGGLAETAAGQLAESEASDPKVKGCGALMVKDQSANAQLKALAAGEEHHVAPAARASARKQAKLSSKRFRAHKSTLALLNKEISAGQDADAQAFAQKLQPTVQSHLTAIDEIADALNTEH
jgi:putative membrane protein